MTETPLFPYEKFAFRLEFGEGKNTTICWFECEEHLQKYLERYKLDKRTIKIDYRDGESVESSKTNKTKIRQGTGKSHNRNTNTSRKGTKNLDASGNSNRTSKSK